MTASTPGATGHSAATGAGRAASTVDDDLLVGVDIGGTKIAVLITSPDGTVLGRATHASSVADQDGAAEAIVACIDVALADASRTLDQVRVVGIGVPGRVDPVKGHVTLAVNLGWNDLALRDLLEARLGKPCVIENDARAAAVGLHHRRVLGTTDDIAYLAVGTGIAAGVILDGRLHRGARGLAGEIGHVVVDPMGPECACGLRGCLETYVSGPAIARRATEAIAAGRASSLSASGLTAQDVYRAATDGDALACELVEDVGRRLAWAIHLLVMAYDVDRVVLGGGVSHAGATFVGPIHMELDRLRASSALAREQLAPGIVELLPAGADAGAWGAVTIAAVSQGDDSSSPLMEGGGPRP